jgi:predicted Na+-dependent transporter
MGSRPLVLVPILVYTLVQHVVGAIAASLVATPSRA